VTGIAVVYRTSSRDALAALAAGREAVDAYETRVCAALDRIGVGRHTRMVTTGWRPGRFAGLDISDSELLPAGWRRAVDGFAVPDEMTAAGLRARRAVDSVRYPGDPRTWLPGMPGCADAGGRMVTFDVYPAGRLLYVAWPARVPEEQVDDTIWARVPSSVWPAALAHAGAMAVAAP